MTSETSIVGVAPQKDLFSSDESPVLAACGLGVDSVAMIIELVERGDRIDYVLFANAGAERPETVEYKPIFADWLASHGVPFAEVTYEPQNFKNWPPYRTLEENCITNGTLPSIAFGFASCSSKWKIAPQNKWAESWEPARVCWAAGGKVTKLIGYDCSPQDLRRYAEREGYDDPRYVYRYPLRELHWVRSNCVARIRRAGLPVPVKSSCFFCTAMKPEEVDSLSRMYLRRIVLLEARAAPRLTRVEGLWRNSVKGVRTGKPRPGSMTAYIRSRGLLPDREIDWIIEHAPKALIRWQQEHGHLPIGERPEVREWLAFFDAFSADDWPAGEAETGLAAVAVHLPGLSRGDHP